MNPFKAFEGLVAPLDHANIDTDIIMPKQFLTAITRTGFGAYIFDAWRYRDIGYPGKPLTLREPNSDFVLNQEKYHGAEILLTRDNFGCGSSREHAPWGLKEFGFKAIIAPNFADIFANNCTKNGILLIRLESEKIDHLFAAVNEEPGYSLGINLLKQRIILPNGESWTFTVDPAVKLRLINGLDDIEMTLQHKSTIQAFESKHQQQQPWLWQKMD